MPLALRRAPSRLTPDVDGSNPFSYPRLVQPVLDQHCVECHAKTRRQGHQPRPRADRAANGTPRTTAWSPSSASTTTATAYRTTPGQFGAQASKLYEMLQKGHYDVKLSDEEMHRLTLWLDCCSMFYGVYEKEGGEAQLRGEIARPTLE